MSLSAAKKRDILICCIAALLILCAMAARILGSPEWAPGLGPMIRNMDLWLQKYKNYLNKSFIWSLFCFHCPLRPCSAGRVPDPPRPYAFRTPAIRGVAAAFRICRFGDSFEHSWRILPGFYYFCPDFPAYL